MLEIGSNKKHRVNINEYDYQSDLRYRNMLSECTPLDIEVLEEILYSPLKISMKTLEKNVNLPLSQLEKSLEKFKNVHLLSIEGEWAHVDKELRKYFEFEICRFQEDFKPDMEFLQGLLRKVPIHLLPTWYAIPRTSDTIFGSIVEKYLMSPLLYQRYIEEILAPFAPAAAIAKDLFASEELRVSSSDVIAKYNLKREEFERIVLHLEFHFVACLCYERQDEHWHEYLFAFHEWAEYLKHYRSTKPRHLDPAKIQKLYENDFGFIEEMSAFLKNPQSHPMSPAIKKLVFLGLAQYEKGHLFPSKEAKQWLDLPLEEKALFLYRHPQNQSLPEEIGEKALREIEKSLQRISDGHWVYFEDFFKGFFAQLSEDSKISLRKKGRHWEYRLPRYTEKEKKNVHSTIFSWLSEMGIVQIGKLEGRDCFRLTSFGKTLFSE